MLRQQQGRTELEFQTAFALCSSRYSGALSVSGTIMISDNLRAKRWMSWVLGINGTLCRTRHNVPLLPDTRVRGDRGSVRGENTIRAAHSENDVDARIAGESRQSDGLTRENGELNFHRRVAAGRASHHPIEKRVLNLAALAPGRIAGDPRMAQGTPAHETGLQELFCERATQAVASVNGELCVEDL